MDVHTSFIPNSHKQEITWPSVGEGLSKRWYILSKEYYSAMKRSKLLIHVTPWMDLKGNVLSEKTATPGSSCAIYDSSEDGNIQR